MAERVDIRVVQDSLERRRVHAAVHRREHALVEGRERKLNGLETLVGNDVDAACRSGDVEFNAANDRYLANLARDKVQVGEMPLVRAVRIGGAVVGDGDSRKTAVLGRLHHFGERAECVVGYIGVGMQVCDDLHGKRLLLTYDFLG